MCVSQGWDSPAFPLLEIGRALILYSGQDGLVIYIETLHGESRTFFQAN